MERTFELKRLPLWPVLKVAFILLLVIGVLIAIFYGVLLSLVGFMAGTLGGSPFGNEFAVFQKLGLVMVPIVAFSYAIIGTIGTLIWVLIYNLIASITGGVELVLTEREVTGLQRPQEAKHPQMDAHIPERPINGF